MLSRERSRLSRDEARLSQRTRTARHEGEPAGSSTASGKHACSIGVSDSRSPSNARKRNRRVGENLTLDSGAPGGGTASSPNADADANAPFVEEQHAETREILHGDVVAERREDAPIAARVRSTGPSRLARVS